MDLRLEIPYVFVLELRHRHVEFEVKTGGMVILFALFLWWISPG